MTRHRVFLLPAVMFCVCMLPFMEIAHGQSTQPKEAPIMSHATGSFTVSIVKQEDQGQDPKLGRFTLDKQYHGDLQATGKGQMLTAGTDVKGSGAYVAIERVEGNLKGRDGGFTLQHSGTMTQNVPQLAVTIVPDSGTEALKGISGKMTITITPDGKHTYDLEYTIPN